MELLCPPWRLLLPALDVVVDALAGGVVAGPSRSVERCVQYLDVLLLLYSTNTYLLFPTGQRSWNRGKTGSSTLLQLTTVVHI